MNKFYKCKRGPKTDFDKLRENKHNWIPKLERYEVKKNGCWEWQGALNNNGYGVVSVYQIGYKKPKLEYTHRLSYFLHKDKIPENLVVDHICENHKCMNPNHLTLKTHEVNAISSKEMTHCGICGSEKYRAKSGRLCCRTCGNKKSREYKRRVRERKANLVDCNSTYAGSSPVALSN